MLKRFIREYAVSWIETRCSMTNTVRCLSMSSRDFRIPELFAMRVERLTVLDLLYDVGV
jgi:hypothetical protein